MKAFIKSKKGLALLATVVAIAVAGAAYASFSSSGSGSGTGTVGTSTGFTVAGGSVVGSLYPDLSAAAGPDYGVVTSASVKNPATAHGDQTVHQVVATITVSNSSPLAFLGERACAASDFQFYSPTATWSGSGSQTATITPNDDLAPGASYSIGDLDVVMVDDLVTPADQDNCQGQTVTVTFNAS